MPKIVNKYPDEEEDEELEFEEEEEEEEEEEAPKEPPKKLPKLPKPSKKVEEPKPAASTKKRFSAFIQQPAEGIVDSETNEVIAMSVYEALANIIERLERIEIAIGMNIAG